MGALVVNQNFGVLITTLAITVGWGLEFSFTCITVNLKALPLLCQMKGRGGMGRNGAGRDRTGWGGVGRGRAGRGDGLQKQNVCYLEKACKS